jgi:hypothetical protein
MLHVHAGELATAEREFEAALQGLRGMVERTGALLAPSAVSS